MGHCPWLTGPGPAQAGVMEAADGGCLDMADSGLKPSPHTWCCQQHVSAASSPEGEA